MYNQESQTDKNESFEVFTSATSCFGDEFNFDDILIEVTKAETKTSSQQVINPQAFAVSLGERIQSRIRDCDSFTTLVEEVKNQQDMTEVEIRMRPRTRSVTVEQLLEGLEIKGRAVVKTDYGVYTLPIPSSKSLNQFSQVLQGSTMRAFDKLLAAHNLMSTRSLDLEKLSHDLKINAEKAVGKIRTSEVKKDILRDILVTYMLESMAENLLLRMNSEYGKADVWKDPVSEGLMVVNPSDNHPCMTASRSRTMAPKYLLDDGQTQLLKAMAFSSNPRDRAGAKLTLNAKLPRSIMNDISRNPRKVLAHVLSEAGLTSEEVIATIFATRKADESRCPACGNDVGIIGIVYHCQCEVITWLETYFFFSYNSEQGSLTAQTTVYLDHNQRAILELISDRAKQLDSPLSHQRSGRYTTIEVKGKKVNSISDLQTNPVNVVGSSEWLEKQRRDRKY